MNVLISLQTRLAWILQAGGALALFFMMVTIGYDALMRYFLSQATSWSMEINAFLLIYLALVTAADTLRRGEQIGITFFADRLTPPVQRIVRVIIALAGAGFSFILVWRGFLMAYDAFEFGERVSSSFGTPMWIPYSLIPVGFFALGTQFLLGIWVEPRGRGPETQNIL